jgi:hypothetical protein
MFYKWFMFCPDNGGGFQQMYIGKDKVVCRYIEEIMART